MLEFENMLFDDYVKDDTHNTYWSQICNHCAEINKVPEINLDEVGSGICGIKGCYNQADHYIDFSVGGVTIKE